MNWRAAISAGFFAGAAMVGITVVRLGTNKAANQSEPTEVPVIVKPFRAAKAAVAADLRCDTAYVTQPGTLQKFSCTLKNSSNKEIVAAAVEYSIILESNGEKVTDTRVHTLVTSLDKDLTGPGKFIPAGGESIVGPPGPMFYANSVIKGIEVKVDYLEFLDNTTLADTDKGSKIIANVRAGAAKYRSWVFKKYKQKGESIDALSELLRGGDLPNATELNLNIDEEDGARAYRTLLRHAIETRGAAEVRKILSK
jgi:hypothetical protein